MSTSPPKVARRSGNQLPEVENAVLDVLDHRGVKSGQTIMLHQIEIVMDARGYGSKRVRRALKSLIDKGLLCHVGAQHVQWTAEAPIAGKNRRTHRVPRRRTRRATMF